jgi:hypothetical protein
MLISRRPVRSIIVGLSTNDYRDVLTLLHPTLYLILHALHLPFAYVLHLLFERGNCEPVPLLEPFLIFSVSIQRKHPICTPGYAMTHAIAFQQHPLFP